MAKDDSIKSSDRVEATTPALPDRIQALAERSQRVWMRSMDRAVDDITTLRPDPLNTAPAMAKLAFEYVDRPQKAAEAAMRFWAAQTDLYMRTWQKLLGEANVAPAAEAKKSDKRFKNEAWADNPVLDYVKQSYLLTADWLSDQVKRADTLSQKDRRKLDLVVRNFIEAHAPSNYPALNPDVLSATIDEKGENLIRGLEHLVRDMEMGEGHLRIRQTDPDAFQVGGNMANTPGSVVFENDVMQLIQYAPSTETVHERPLLFVPPWINKFYILDLNEKKSMVRWLVAQGYTVFLVSWVNPGPAQKEETWETYMKKGVITAIDKVLEETGADKTNIVGYCIGGTMLGTTLA
ncbi:MAG: alpha/beta fold hydrolase, partial [Pseudomonadota bacterium]